MYVQQTFNKIVSKGRDSKLLSQLVGHVFERGHLLSRVHLNAISISEKKLTLQQGSISCDENHIFPPYQYSWSARILNFWAIRILPLLEAHCYEIDTKKYFLLVDKVPTGKNMPKSTKYVGDF